MIKSSAGYVRCPSCLSHVREAEDARCPFCKEPIEDRPLSGHGVLERLKASRVGFIALGLATGLTFGVACGTDNKRDEPSNVDLHNDYGGFDPFEDDEEEYDEPDAGETDAGDVQGDAGADAGADAGVDAGTDAGYSDDAGNADAEHDG